MAECRQRSYDQDLAQAVDGVVEQVQMEHERERLASARAVDVQH